MTVINEIILELLEIGPDCRLAVIPALFPAVDSCEFLVRDGQVVQLKMQPQLYNYLFSQGCLEHLSEGALCRLTCYDLLMLKQNLINNLSKK